MKIKLEKLILKFYCLLPIKLKQNTAIINIAQTIAEHQLLETKQKSLKANWSRCQLEQQLIDLKRGYDNE